MKNLSKIVDGYLEKKSDYAIQISGNWGYGKTYYYRNVLEPLICNKPTYTDAEKKYKAIYIPLFGLKSIEDIATKIVMDFYQSSLFKDYFKSSRNKKKLRITQTILKIGLRGFIGFNRLGNVNEYLTDIKQIGQDVLDTSEIVVCFDDLERRDSALSLEDLTGYINGMVDENIKVLVISNEDLLIKSGDAYKNLIEKIIGIKIEYAPEISDIIYSIIENQYKGFNEFRNFLNINKAILMNFAVTVNKNFRHFIYALDNLHQCYSIIKNEIIDTKHEIHAKIEEQLPNIILFILSFSAEYKASNLKYNEAVEYNNKYWRIQEFLSQNISPKKDEDKPLKKHEILTTKYNIAKGDYHFYNSIFNYITGVNEFDIATFTEEFVKEFNLRSGVVSREYQVFNELSYYNFINLSDQLYKQRTLEVIEYAKSGLYKVPEYLTVMHYAERFDNLSNLNLNDILNSLSDGLKKAISNSINTNESEFTQFNFSGQQIGLSEHNKQLYEIGQKLIAMELQKREREKTEIIIDLFLKKPDEFLQKAQSDAEFRYQINQYQFLRDVSSNVLFNIINNASTATLFRYQTFFKERYNVFEMFSTELPKLKELNKLLADENNTKIKEGKSLRNYFLAELITILSKLELQSVVFQ